MHRPHDLERGVGRPPHELVAVVVDHHRDPGDARGHRRLGDRRRHPPQDAGIERLGDEVVGAELDRLAAVGRDHRLRHRLLGQGRQRPRGRDLHRLGDAPGPHVEGAAEDVREAEDVVDLVGIVGASGRHQRVGAGRDRVGVADLGVGVGHREDDRPRAHGGEHRRRDQAGHRQAHEHVGADQRVGQGPAAVVGAREPRLVAIEIGAPGVQHALGVAQRDVARVDAERDEEVDAGDRRGAGAGHHQPEVGQRLAGEFGGVEQAGAGDDRGAVLVVVEHRDRQPGPQLLLDVEAGRRADVLEVDAAEGRLEGGDDVDQAIDVLLGDLEIEHVDVGELLEQAGLALHHRLAGGRADVAQAEHGGAVRDHRDQIAARGVLPRRVGVAGDLEARLGHARRVGQRQVPLADQGLRRHDLDLSAAAAAVILERIFFAGHGSTLLRSAVDGARLRR